MPLYSYVCQICETSFDAFASIEKKEKGWKPKCPNCGGAEVRQNYRDVAWVGKSDSLPRQGGCCSPR